MPWQNKFRSGWKMYQTTVEQNKRSAGNRSYRSAADCLHLFVIEAQ
jgi:hypothetical protein